MKQTVLITGSSSGFGAEFAKLFAADGYNLVLVALKGSGLAAQAKKLSDTYSVKTWYLEIDLSQPDAAEKLYAWTQKQHITVTALVNNAGIGLFGRFTDHSLQEERALVNLDVLNPTELCHLYIPNMIKNGSGQILNVASIAGLQAGPLYATYFASKAYLLLLSEALHDEYAPHITVTAVCPGVARTQFFRRAGMREDSRLLQSYLMSPERVAKAGYRGLQQGKRIVIPGKRNKFVALGYRVMPRATITKITHRLIIKAGGNRI